METSAKDSQDLSPNSKYVPPKEWDAITDSEKIERMRSIIKDMNRAISYLQTEVHHFRNGLKTHSHADNKVVVPFNEFPNPSLNGVGGASLGVSNYF